VVTCHGSEITMAQKGLKRMALYGTIKHASWLIAGNNHVRGVLQQFNLPNTPVSVIGLGVDAEVFRPDLDSDFLKIKYGCRQKKVLLTVAELKKRKGVDKVLQAMSLLGDRGREVLYLIVGSGPDRGRLMEITRRLGLNERVIFADPVSDRDIPYYYAICDVYIMPNRQEEDGDIEGFGITFIEAQASEKPVIGGLSGGVPDAVADKRTGFLVNPLDEKEIAGRILELIENSEAARAMGKSGRERVTSLFQWPVIASKTEMIYAKLFEKVRRR
jgi:phosphatidylinositol alpha-1,6-mannosyltransferase